ncbi:MAG TPA: right-handed parallel beta-helix repeat-containing protein [Kofleriaceae bacterium]|nr:right-handed parallel beta-helix repeat-containing protein [Kofleriaceae bacterium]
MPRLAYIVIWAVIGTGCKSDNSQSCELPGNANKPVCGGDGGSDGGPCKKNDDCKDTPTSPVCDTSKPGGGVCVQCTADQIDQCGGTAPRCDVATNMCVACVDDKDCGTAGVCLASGACAESDTIIHAVAAGGLVNALTCGALGSACDLETALAVAKASSSKNVIKLDDPEPAVYKGNNANFLVDVDISSGLIIDARGARIERGMDDAPILTINTGKGATLLGGTIQGAHGSGADAIRCNTGGTLTLQGTTLRMSDASGINASGCTVAVVDSNITDNNKAGTTVPGIVISGGSVTISRSVIASNQGGGIVVNNLGKFIVVGNAFLANGDPGIINGGFTASTTASGNRLEFNTFAENKSDSGIGAGVQCTVSGFTAQNNIIWNNNGPAGMQVSGNCKHAFSDIGPMSIIGVTQFDGGNNLSMDPMFMSATTDLRLRAGTPVRGKANPAADLTGVAETDITHTKRTAPADLGAYVAPPPM